VRYVIFDLETYKDFSLAVFKFTDSPQYYVYEVSDRKDNKDELLKFLSYLQTTQTYMVGYNSLGFDYPILHDLINNHHTFHSNRFFELADDIINGPKTEYGFSPYNVRLRDRLIPQIDLVKINHFDNRSKRTRLKEIEFTMRSPTVEDLPFDFRKPTNDEQKQKVIEYCIHDVAKTEDFFHRCSNAINMRHNLLIEGVLTGDVLNYSDVKIGTEFFINKLGRENCFYKGKAKQTFRNEIKFANIILPKISFRTDEFNEVLTWFKSQTHYVDNSAPNFQTTINGLEFHFGIGGIHASVESKVFKSNDEYIIKDVDVTGMYPAIAIANNFYPAHLGTKFVDVYKQLRSDRKQYAKGSPMNATLKLAMNGVYGNSNNPYSPIYDPQYMFTITINGQLQLFQLSETLSLIPGLKLIQANTDGVTAYVPRRYEYLFNFWCGEWEKLSGLNLEHVDYESMHIRDVNNYISKTVDGKVKRKGAYWYPEKDSEYSGVWNKDYSMMIVQKAASAWLLEGINPEAYVNISNEPYDFMKRYKTPGSAKVYIGDDEVTKTVRYYVCKTGKPMRKLAPPKGPLGEFKRANSLTDTYFEKVKSEIPPGSWDERIHTKNKSTYAEVITGVESGKLVKECNNMVNFDWDDVDFDYYIEEIKKLNIEDEA
jgi:hypothetical protein